MGGVLSGTAGAVAKVPAVGEGAAAGVRRGAARELHGQRTGAVGYVARGHRHRRGAGTHVADFPNFRRIEVHVVQARFGGTDGHVDHNGPALHKVAHHKRLVLAVEREVSHPAAHVIAEEIRVLVAGREIIVRIKNAPNAGRAAKLRAGHRRARRPNKGRSGRSARKGARAGGAVGIVPPVDERAGEVKSRNAGRNGLGRVAGVGQAGGPAPPRAAGRRGGQPNQVLKGEVLLGAAPRAEERIGRVAVADDGRHYGHVFGQAFVQGPAQVQPRPVHHVHFFPGRKAHVADVEGAGVGGGRAGAARTGLQRHPKRVAEAQGPHLRLRGEGRGRIVERVAGQPGPGFGVDAQNFTAEAVHHLRP